MNNLQHTNLNAYIRERVRLLVDIRKATSMCLGVAIGRRLPVIASDPVQALQVYTNQYTYQVMALAGQFNEQTIVDIEHVDKIAKGIWCMRQATAYPPVPTVAPRGAGTFFEKIANVPYYLEPADMAYFNEHAEVLLTIINRMADILEGMAPQQQGA